MYIQSAYHTTCIRDRLRAFRLADPVELSMGLLRGFSLNTTLNFISQRELRWVDVNLPDAIVDESWLQSRVLFEPDPKTRAGDASHMANVSYWAHGPELNPHGIVNPESGRS